MNNEDEISPSNAAELADQGQGHTPGELSKPASAEPGNQGYSAAGEVGLIKSRRTFRENLWRGLKSAPPTALFGLTVISIYVIFAVFAPLLAPYGEAEIFPMS